MKATVLFLVVGSSWADRDAFTILHTNDVHSHYDQTNKYGTDCTNDQKATSKCFGGLARLKTKIDEYRKANKNTILLDSGDQFQGTLFYTHYKGNATWKAMNHLQYDISTLGNHEFDNGPEELARVIREYKFPVVSSNIDVSGYPGLDRVIKKHHVIKEHSLGVVGCLTCDAPSISSLGRVTVEDPTVAVQREINQLNRQGIKRIIAVSHYGYAEDIKLAAKVKGLALIVGGHSHSYLATKPDASSGIEVEGKYPTPVVNGDGNITYVVQAYQWGRFLGHVDIKFDQAGYIHKIRGGPISLDAGVKMNPKTDQLVKEMRHIFDAKSREVIGYARATLEQASCRVQECGIGMLVADAILDYRRDANFAIFNAGGVRAAIPKGNVTVGDVLSVFPFRESIVVMKLTGKQIWNLLEGVAAKKDSSGKEIGFIQVSGLRFTYSEVAPIGQRIGRVVILDPTSKTYHPIHLNRTYAAASYTFFAQGGDRIVNPPQKHLTPLKSTEEIVMAYIKAQKYLTLPTGHRIIKVHNILDPLQPPRHPRCKPRSLTLY